MNRHRYHEITWKLSLWLAAVISAAFWGWEAIHNGETGTGSLILYALVAACTYPFVLMGLAAVMAGISAIVDPYLKMKERVEKAERHLGYRL